ncbi:MAG: flagellin [Myxococcota bacterium]|nr:flagellin [Myxococcota bacterium]
MALVVRSNPQSVFAQNRLNKSQGDFNSSLEKLASGSRINKAADDSAGMAVSTVMEHRIKAQSAARQNAQEGISLIQTAEGGVEQVRGMLDRMRELAVRSSNDTLSDSDRGNSNLEFQQLKVEITRIGESTTYNGKNLLSASTGLIFQVGMDNDANNRISVVMTGNFIASAGGDGMGLSGDVASIAAAASMLTKIDGALSVLNSYRSKLGSTQNRLERAIGNLDADIENSVSANSRIRDVDFASETAKFTRSQILIQSGTAILSQANSSPQAALSLLG